MPIAMQLENDIGVFVPVDAVYGGVVASEEEMDRALSQLSRDDALFFCARINTITSGFTVRMTNLERQQAALALLRLQAEGEAINRFAKEHGAARQITVFFRGQLLELARRIAINCINHAGDGETFNDPPIRSAFLRAALIASDLWGRRVYGTRLRDEGGPREQLHRALGAFRKGLEEANSAPHAGIAIGRGWLLFSQFLRNRLPTFDGLFESATGLSLEAYFVCAAALFKYTLADNIDGPRFRTRYVAEQTAFRDKFDVFIALQSWSPEQFGQCFKGQLSGVDYRPLRERPILSFWGDRSAILDPEFFSDNLTIAPLFHVIAKVEASKVNDVFSAFGFAFEDYAIELLRSMYPAGQGVLAQRLTFNVKGQTTDGHNFEIDALLNNVKSAVVFEMKAAWIREDKVLTDESVFLEHVREKYGRSSKGDQRPKGVAQLARIIQAIIRGEWKDRPSDVRAIRTIYPVLAVHDERIAAPGFGNVLDEDFRSLLGPIPKGMTVHPLIVMTIADLENLASSIDRFGLEEFLSAYSREYPDRMRSVRNFMGSSEFVDKIAPPRKLIDAFEMLMAVVRAELFPKGESREDGVVPAA